MGDGQKPRCTATTKAGTRCSRSATTGDMCATHAQQRTEAQESLWEFLAMAERINAELDDPRYEMNPATRAKYWALLINCTKLAKEEERILEGLGAMSDYVMVLQLPRAPAEPTKLAWLIRAAEMAAEQDADSDAPAP